MTNQSPDTSAIVTLNGIEWASAPFGGDMDLWHRPEYDIAADWEKVNYATLDPDRIDDMILARIMLRFARGGLSSPKAATLAQALTLHLIATNVEQHAQANAHYSGQCLARFCPVQVGERHEFDQVADRVTGKKRHMRMRVVRVTCGIQGWSVAGVVVRADGTEGTAYANDLIPYTAVPAPKQEAQPCA
jgi:hypothetical protein